MSDALERVVINTPDEAPPVGHDQKMIDLVDSKAVDARPEWLPEKFSTVEQMAESYKALEAKLGGAPAAAEVAPAAPVAAPQTNALAIEATAAVASAGLDMAALNQEFAESGALSEKSMAALAAKGFDKATVDGYVAGQQALMSQFQTEVKSVTPGGADKYGDMVAWAKVNLNESETNAFNTAVGSGSKDQAKLAVAGLGARYTAAVGNEPTLQGGRVGTASADVFESIAQMTTAMKDPRYKEDPAYRRSVAAKLGRSSIL